jgi:hypothetical protein
MKKIISVLLTVFMMFGVLSFTSGAKSTYNATWKLTGKVGNNSYTSSDTIVVAPGDKVLVTLSVTNDYYTGPTCVQLFYTSALFSGATNGTFNKNGKFYKTCGGYCTFVDWSGIAEGNRNQGWPAYSAAKLAEYKSTHQFLRITMTPDIMVTNTAAKSLNEDLITMQFNVSSSAKNGDTGEIALPIETMRTSSNKFGFFFSGIYTDGNMSKTPLAYSDDQSFDCSKAILKFRVSTGGITLGDVNNDKNINSMDALLILQYVVGKSTLSATQLKAADVNVDGKVNSTDALKILQYSVGQIKSF